MDRAEAKIRILLAIDLCEKAISPSTSPSTNKKLLHNIQVLKQRLKEL